MPSITSIIYTTIFAYIILVIELYLALFCNKIYFESIFSMVTYACEMALVISIKLTERKKHTSY